MNDEQLRILIGMLVNVRQELVNIKPANPHLIEAVKLIQLAIQSIKEI
jgi:hypothetical protein